MKTWRKHFVRTMMMLCYLGIVSLLINRCRLYSWYSGNVVQDLTSELGWNSVILIYDHTTSHLFRIAAIRQEHYTMDKMNIASILQNIHSSRSLHLNIIVAVNYSQIFNVINTIDWFDMVSNRTTNYQHKSRILILLNKTPVDFEVEHLENVAVCVLRDNIENHVSQRWSIKCSTLIIHPHERVFVPVHTNVTNLTCFHTSLFPNLSKGYNKRLLKVSSLESPPYVIKQHISKKSILYTGYLFDIWSIIMDKLNISYEVIEPVDKRWGSQENGQWDGMVKQLIEKEVDVAVTDMTVTAQRSEVIDFIFPSVMVDSTDIIYKREKSQLKTFSLLMGPLSLSVYLVLLSVWISTSVLYMLVETEQSRRQNYKCQGHGQRIYNTRTLFSVRLFVHSAWCFLATILKQGFPIIRSSSAGSMLLSSWLFLVLLVTSVYCANLIAALSSQSGLSSLSSVDELVDSDYTTGMFTTGLPYETMQTTKRPDLKKLFIKMSRTNKSDSGIFKNDMEEHISRVKNGGHSLIIYKSTAAKYINEDCQLAYMKESIIMSEEYISFALPKGSPLKHDFEKILSNLRDTGILEHLWRNWTRSTNRTCDVSRDQTSISLREVSGGLLLVCAGLGLACAVLAVEICQRCSEKKKKECNNIVREKQTLVTGCVNDKHTMDE